MLLEYMLDTCSSGHCGGGGGGGGVQETHVSVEEYLDQTRRVLVGNVGDGGEKLKVVVLRVDNRM